MGPVGRAPLPRRRWSVLGLIGPCHGLPGAVEGVGHSRKAGLARVVHCWGAGGADRQHLVGLGEGGFKTAVRLVVVVVMVVGVVVVGVGVGLVVRGHCELIQCGDAWSWEVLVSFHEPLGLLQWRPVALRVGDGRCRLRSHGANVAGRSTSLLVDGGDAAITSTGLLLQQPDLRAQIREHREQSFYDLLVLVDVHCLRGQSHLHILIGAARVLLELLHPVGQGLVGILELAESFLELLDLERARIVELGQLFPRGWSLSTDVVEVIFAILGEFGMFKLPALRRSAGRQAGRWRERERNPPLRPQNSPQCF